MGSSPSSGNVSPAATVAATKDLQTRNHAFIIKEISPAV
jgi:hypothetical protein